MEPLNAVSKGSSAAAATPPPASPHAKCVLAAFELAQYSVGKCEPPPSELRYLEMLPGDGGPVHPRRATLVLGPLHGNVSCVSASSERFSDRFSMRFLRAEGLCWPMIESVAS